MVIDRQSKTIYYEPYELLIVQNYTEHCLTPMERKQWKLRLVSRMPAEATKVLVERGKGKR